MRVRIRNAPFPLQIWRFAICRLGHQECLRIYDLRITHYKFADLRFADWHTSEICGFAICGQKKFCVPTFAPRSPSAHLYQPTSSHIPSIAPVQPLTQYLLFSSFNPPPIPIASPYSSFASSHPMKPQTVLTFFSLTLFILSPYTSCSPV
jgi:hypothetical protein